MKQELRERLSASVDAGVLAAGRQAVSDGAVESLSAWVNLALHRQVEHDRRTQALKAFISDFEAEHGEITDADIDEATRQARARAIVVRPNRRRSAA